MPLGPAQPPDHRIRRWLPAPSPSPARPPSSVPPNSQPPPSRLPIYFSPPLIAMVVIAAATFLIVTYSRLISHRLLPPILRLFRRYRRWRRRRRFRRHPSSLTGSDLQSPRYFETGSNGLGAYSPYGLDESAIRAMPLSIYSEKSRLIEEFSCDCAVCLLEFEDNDYVRTLPHCCHSFHVDCIDVWLRSHATCPLCRAGILPLDSSPRPFAPLMAARIRPSLDEGLLDNMFLDPLPESSPQPPSLPPQPSRLPGTRRSASMAAAEGDTEIEIEISATPCDRSDMVLKRSYSFGFERSFASAMEPATASSPWRFHHHRRGGSSFWRRPSPFGSIAKSRVFSFRSYRGMKSPFFFSSRRRGFVPLSESAGMRYSSSYYYYYYQCHYSASGAAAAGGSSSRRSKSFASPMFGSSAAASSRMRCGDPEALLSPERFGRR